MSNPTHTAVWLLFVAVKATRARILLGCFTSMDELTSFAAAKPMDEEQGHYEWKQAPLNAIIPNPQGDGERVPR